MAFSIANIELENTSTAPSGDITSVFGSGSPQWTFSKANSSGAGRTLATADFEGVAIHCSQGDSTSSGICSPQNGGVADKLPDEPGPA